MIGQIGQFPFIRIFFYFCLPLPPSPLSLPFIPFSGEIAPRTHLVGVVLTVLSDIPGVETGVCDGHQATSPHLALHHVQQQAELALLPAGVAAAPPE